MGQRVKVGATRKFANTSAGFTELTDWVNKHADPAIPIVYTHSNRLYYGSNQPQMHDLIGRSRVYYEQIAWYLFTLGQSISVVLPNKARQYAKSLGLKSKNDKMDAIGLARMGAEQNLPPWQPMSKLFYQLRALT